MNILLLGSGGREHAFAWKMAQSKACDHLFIAPGNAGTGSYGTNVLLSITNFPAIREFCVTQQIGLLVVGPEEPLVKGIVDYFKEYPVEGLLIIGPTRYGAQLEGSKAFAKAFMQRHGIPTAAYREFDENSFEAGLSYIEQHTLPIVLKADGLAAGKGVLILTDRLAAKQAFEEMIKQKKFGDASKKVVIEEFLDGIEMSVFVLTDGVNFVLLPSAKDYKRIGEGDSGLNTGGMGAVSPVPFADAGFMDQVMRLVVEPTIRGIAEEQIDYIGFVFVGLIKVDGAPMVIEYNCRMGDPETEVVLPRLKTDLVELLVAAGQKKLQGRELLFDDRVACTVMAVSGGYPGDYEKGKEITGLDAVLPADVLLFHAGTAVQHGQVVTQGGRVLCATAFGATIPEAVRKSAAALAGIHYEGMYFRTDIGYEFPE
jgi:phosphoribosylamine---glycine ligase